MVFSCQFVDVLNAFIGCQQNWRKNTIFMKKSVTKYCRVYNSLWYSNLTPQKILVGHICYSKQNLLPPHFTVPIQHTIFCLNKNKNNFIIVFMSCTILKFFVIYQFAIQAKWKIFIQTLGLWILYSKQFYNIEFIQDLFFYKY